MYSSTTLEGPSKSGCWKMLDYAEQNADSLFPLEYRSYLGQAAHAVMQYCAERKTETEEDIRNIGEEVGNLLIREGREFRGRKEPPLPADDVWAGVDVAVRYLLARGLPLDADTMLPERDWVHTNLPYRALIDLVTVYEEGEEEYAQHLCEVTDYKSSWQAGEEQLDTLQRWGQAIVVWRNNAMPDIIRQRVVNLRTWGEWTRDIRLDDPADVAELEKWEARVEALCNTAADMRGSDNCRPANPGIGCLSCAYRHICQDAWKVGDIPIMGLNELAVELATVEGRRSLLIRAIKEASPQTPVAIQGGVVGFKEKLSRKLNDTAPSDILDEWLASCACPVDPEDMPALESLLVALKLGKANVDALAKALHPERKKGIAAVREAYVNTLTHEVRGSAFGVWRD